MSKDLVLITGASGHLGFRAVVYALEQGYQVRAAVRSQEKANTILEAPSIKALVREGQLTFAIVPDIVVKGAYDEAVQGVTYIVHVASPIAKPSNDYERDAIQPALQSTLNILEAALKVHTVKRIVMTSSIIAVIPWNTFIQEESDQIFTADDRTADTFGPWQHHFEAYAAEKVRALNATDKFVATNKPYFEVSNIMPSFFIGKNELVTKVANILDGTNSVALSPILGKKNDGPLPGAMSHINDVAKAHILALDPEVKGGQNFGLMSGGVAGNQWSEALDAARKHFPAAVADGRLPVNGTQATKRVLFDTSATEKILNFKQQSFEDQVVSVTRHYLDLLEKEGGKTGNLGGSSF